MVLSNRTQGQQAEKLARDFLQQQGLIFITGNFSCRWGEIDLIMREKSTLVFIEIRFRSSSQFGYAIETVTPKKQSKIINTALFFIQCHKKFINYSMRFDVVAFQKISSKTPTKPTLNWIKNAFAMDI